MLSFPQQNNLDDRLKHPNKGIVMAAAKLFLLYTKDMDALKKDIHTRLKGLYMNCYSYRDRIYYRLMLLLTTVKTHE